MELFEAVKIVRNRRMKDINPDKYDTAAKIVEAEAEIGEKENELTISKNDSGSQGKGRSKV